MTRKISRDAARALTNSNDFNRSNTTVKRDRIHINDATGYDWATVLTLYNSRIAFVHCGQLRVAIPEGYATKTTMDRIIAILEMWGKLEMLYMLEREQGRFFNLGTMN